MNRKKKMDARWELQKVLNVSYVWRERERERKDKKKWIN